MARQSFEMQLLACESHPLRFDPIVIDWSDQLRTRWLSGGDSSISNLVPGVAQASVGMASAVLDCKIAPWVLDDLGERRCHSRKGDQELRRLSNTDPNQTSLALSAQINCKWISNIIPASLLLIEVLIEVEYSLFFIRSLRSP